MLQFKMAAKVQEDEARRSKNQRPNARIEAIQVRLGRPGARREAAGRAGRVQAELNALRLANEAQHAELRNEANRIIAGGRRVRFAEAFLANPAALDAELQGAIAARWVPQEPPIQRKQPLFRPP
jgi:hypothetical protein